MKYTTHLVGLLLAVALLALPAPSSGTIVFSAYADTPDIGDAGGCAPGGTIKAISSYHLGSIASMGAGDTGRHFDVDGSLGKCGFFYAMTSCTDRGTAGSDNSASCTTYMEVGGGMCSGNSYKGVTDVYVLVGSESAHAESSCSSC